MARIKNMVKSLVLALLCSPAFAGNDFAIHKAIIVGTGTLPSPPVNYDSSLSSLVILGNFNTLTSTLTITGVDANGYALKLKNGGILIDNTIAPTFNDQVYINNGLGKRIGVQSIPGNADQVSIAQYGCTTSSDNYTDACGIYAGWSSGNGIGNQALVTGFNDFFVDDNVPSIFGTDITETFGYFISVASSSFVGPAYFGGGGVPNTNFSFAGKQYLTLPSGGTVTVDEPQAYNYTGHISTFDVAGNLTMDPASTLTSYATTVKTSIAFSGSSSGLTTVQASATASGTLTLPAATDTVVARATTDTLTNKRITLRTATVTQSATPSINSDNATVFEITGLAQAITNMSTNLTGSPTDSQLMEIQITDNGTARAITWGTSFASTTIALPGTTVISTILRILVQWNPATLKWECIATA